MDFFFLIFESLGYRVVMPEAGIISILSICVQLSSKIKLFNLNAIIYYS